VIRWQAHEALMHRVDAELVIGDPTPIEPQLASDGIDAALTIVHGDLPEWSTFTPDGSVGRIVARDTGGTWNIALGRFTGTSPNTGNVYDRDMLRVVDASAVEPAFTVGGDAADIDGWLWSRAPAARFAIDGDQDVFARLQQVVDVGIQ
jgi:hypothetical protein